VGALALLSFAVDTYEFFFGVGEPQKDAFDWTVVEEYPSQDGMVVAVLEHGVSNNGSHAAPIYRVALQTIDEPEKWQNHWEVWNSQVRERPSLLWLDESNLEIAHTSSQVWQYEPSVDLQNTEYKVHLNVISETP
jgi:hypothetical protein